MKIVFATDGIFPHAIGGIQRHSALLVKALSQYNDLELHVVHPHDTTVFEGLPNIIEHSLQPIDTDRNYLRECYRYSARVEEVIKKVNPDLIYAQGLTVWKNISKYKKILINNPHGLESFQAIGFKDRIIGRIFRAVQRRIFRHSKIIASEGGHLTTILARNGLSDKVVFLPNAVDLPDVYKQHYPDRGQPVKVFFMARFVRNKGIDIVFKAAEYLEQNGYAGMFEFRLGGKGPLYEHYTATNRLKNVTLLGFLSDEQLRREYLNNDIFLLPTLFEGMPTVVLESMALGLPVIVSDVGGTPELINPETGYLIQRGSVKAVCDALIDYLSLSAKEKQALGMAGREKVSKGFTWARLAQMHHTLFSKLNQAGSK